MIIEVLGPGCAKCQHLTEQVKAAAKSLGVEHEVIKIADMEQIAQRGVMMTPALLVNGVVKTVGRVPGDDELLRILQEAD